MPYGTYENFVSVLGSPYDMIGTVIDWMRATSILLHTFLLYMLKLRSATAGFFSQNGTRKLKHLRLCPIAWINFRRISFCIIYSLSIFSDHRAFFQYAEIKDRFLHRLMRCHVYEAATLEPPDIHLHQIFYCCTKVECSAYIFSFFLKSC